MIIDARNVLKSADVCGWMGSIRKMGSKKKRVREEEKRKKKLCPRRERERDQDIDERERASLQSNHLE